MVWYRAEHARLAAVLVGLSGDVELARDVRDEAFARAWLRWRRVRAMERPSGWLYRTAVNELHRRYRRRALERRAWQRQVPTVERSATAAIELWELVAALPLRQRTSVVLRYVADLDETTIAAVMGVTRSTVSSALSAARRHLGVALADDATEVGHE